MSGTPFRLVAAALFFVSGASTLAYQVGWQRVLSQTMGADSVSATFIVTIFMLGLGVGAAVAGRQTGRWRRPLLAYAALELLIGLYGAASIPLLRTVNAWWIERGVNSVVGDFLLNTVLLLPPVLLMGMTTPLLIHIVRGTLRQVGRVVGIMYGANILGAALGALLTGWYLIELWGLDGVALAAAAANVIIAAIFALLAWRGIGPTTDGERPAPAGARLDPRAAAACVLFGFASLGLEIVLIRVVSHYFGLVATTFAAALSAYLVMMGLGEIVGGLLADSTRGRRATPLAAAAALSASVGAVLALSPAQLDRLHLSLGPYELMLLFMSPTLVAAAVFPVIVRRLTARSDAAAANVGRILAYTTAGNALGSFVVGLWALHALGTVGATVLCVGCSLAGAMLLDLGRPSPDAAPRALRWAASIATLAALFTLDSDYYEQFPDRFAPTQRPVEQRETSLGVIAYFDAGHGDGGHITFNRTIATNTRPHVGPPAPMGADSRMRLLRGEREARRVLIIGLGTAELPRAFVHDPSVREVVVVELSQALVDLIEAYSAPELAEALHHEKVRLIIGDGRRYLLRARARGERFDVINVGVLRPHNYGVANLFSREFFQAARDTLTPTGYVDTYAQGGVIRTALEVFDEAVAFNRTSGRVYLSPTPLPADGAVLTVTGQPALVRRCASGTPSFVVHSLDLPELETLPITTDNLPALEYRTLSADHTGGMMLAQGPRLLALDSVTTRTIQLSCPAH